VTRQDIFTGSVFCVASRFSRIFPFSTDSYRRRRQRCIFSLILRLAERLRKLGKKTERERERERERVLKNEVIARESKVQRAAHSTFYRCLLLPELVELQRIYKTCHSTNFSLQMCKYLYLYSTYILIEEIRKQIFFLLYIATSSVNQ